MSIIPLLREAGALWARGWVGARARGWVGMTKSSVFRSGGYGGIKPLNAPRVVYVRTDSAGTPVAVQVPPAITLAPGVRGALGRVMQLRGARQSEEEGTGSERLIWAQGSLSKTRPC